MTDSETPNNGKHTESVPKHDVKSPATAPDVMLNKAAEAEGSKTPNKKPPLTGDNARSANTQKTSSIKKTPDTKNAPPQKKKSKWRNFFIALLCLILLGIIAAGIYYNYSYSRNALAQQKIELQQLKTSLSQSNTSLTQSHTQTHSLTEKNRVTLRNLDNTFSQQGDKYEQRLKIAEDRLQAQNKRLLSLSTTTREDWLLAEAEYLLKLANQRVLIEKNIDGADALLSEADIILRDLDDPDLFPLRKAIHDDLAELRLTVKVDQQGIYLSLASLSSQIESLPILPMTKTLPIKNQLQERSFPLNDTSLSLTQKIKISFSNVLDSLKDYIRITDRTENPILVLTPESALYLQQNLRLMIERAQLALMREQHVIYQSSLEQAQTWIQKYFPANEKRALFLKQLDIEKNKEISRIFPDITDSLELLHNYIEQLHQLNGVGKPKLNSLKKADKNASSVEAK